MANKFQCYDKDGRLVVCSCDNWDSHVVAEHPEMAGWEAYVKATIESPHRIYQDARHTSRKILYKPFILPKPFNNQWLRVAIEYKKPAFKEYRGYLLTAFPCVRVKKGDILIWESLTLI